MTSCFCDFDPPSFYSRAIHKARKEHQCEECGGQIKSGERYEYVSGKWDGSVDQFRTCERCFDIRQWVQNNVPCFCWAHGSMKEDAQMALDEAVYRAPQETVGLRFGLLRRFALLDRHNGKRWVA
jgi:hypothetical protein